MKSAIGIGALLADGLGDTVRVSLTEDPEFELVPCQKLITIGSELLNTPSKFSEIPEWKETSRNFTAFNKRRGDLPIQQEGDSFDIRGLMHRDGSVFTTVSLADLQTPDLLYKQLGTKSVVGMPFKDIATSDSIYLPQVPAVGDTQLRKSLKRLQDVAVGVLADYAQLSKNPLPNSVAIVTLDEIITNKGLPALPTGSIRYAIKVSGIEPESSYMKLPDYFNKLVTMIIIETPMSVSRVHASRRVFELLSQKRINLPVIHHCSYNQLNDKDDLILRAGSEAGALLVDGLGDGVLISTSSPSVFNIEMLRTTSFNLLQGA